jgi:putative addiction module component (TIGR02574 family)
MSATTTPEARDILDRAMKLSNAERETIAIELLDSLDGPPDDPDEVKKSWREEIAKRIEDIKTGRVQTIDAHEALDRVEQKLREKSGQ